MGEIISMSAKDKNDRNRVEEIFGINLNDGKQERQLYIKELDASMWSRNASDCGRVIARGGENLPFSAHIKFRRHPKNTDYDELGVNGEFKVNINGKGCEIS